MWMGTQIKYWSADKLNLPASGFSLSRLHMGGFVPPGGQSINGGGT